MGFSTSRATWPMYDDKERLRGKFSEDVDKMGLLAYEEPREKYVFDISRKFSTDLFTELFCMKQ